MMIIVTSQLKVLDNIGKFFNILYTMILKGYFKYGDKMRRMATIIKKERMMSRRTERMVRRMAMKAREGWGLSLAPDI